jgi:hypothetical protein
MDNHEEMDWSHEAIPHTHLKECVKSSVLKSSMSLWMSLVGQQEDVKCVNPVAHNSFLVSHFTLGVQFDMLSFLQKIPLIFG